MGLLTDEKLKFSCLVPAFGHSHPVINARLFRDIRYPTSLVRFPNLRDCVVKLVGKLAGGNPHDIKFMGYETLLESLVPQHVLLKSIVDEAMTQIEPEILDLQRQDCLSTTLCRKPRASTRLPMD